MKRMLVGVLVGLLLLAARADAAADAGNLTGNWKVVLLVQGQRPVLWLVKLTSKDGKIGGEVLGTDDDDNIRKAKEVDVAVKENQLELTFKGKGQRFASFQGLLPEAGAKSFSGSILLGRRMFPAVMETTALQTLDKFDVNKEIVSAENGGPEVVDAALILLKEAGAKKPKPEEVRSWAAKAVKISETFGRRYHREIILRIADLLSDQEAFGPVALEYARKAERSLDPGDTPGAQRRALEVLGEALKKNGKADEAKEVENRVKKIEMVKVEPFAGRKNKSDRVILVELFTGAQCPPCVAADLGFDALAKTYKPNEVALLEYHLHIPGPDPLTNPDSEARLKFYGSAIEGTPAIFFDGKAEGGGGGSVYDGQDKYESYRDLVGNLLEKPEVARMTLSALKKGNKIDINTEVLELQKPGENVRLRFALVEEQINYTGGNRLAVHHHVVRALPGGAQGTALTDKSAKKTASVDLDELKKSLKKYLDEYGEKDGFPNKERPLEFKNLSVVAFIQNDDTKEILQSVQTEVKKENE